MKNTLTTGLRCEWRRLARTLADPAIELDVETFAEIIQLAGRMKAAGIKLDAMADAMILQGQYSMIVALDDTANYLTPFQRTQYRALLTDGADPSDEFTTDSEGDDDLMTVELGVDDEMIGVDRNADDDLMTLESGVME